MRLVEITKKRWCSLLVAAADVLVIILGTVRRPDQFARPIFASLLLCWGLVFICSPGSLGRSMVSRFSPVGRFWESLDPGFVSLIGWMAMIFAVPFIAVFAPG
jgi:Mn2+/Fe2+ NRAMP family transporter